MRVVKYPNEYKTWINKNIRRFNFELEFNGKKFTTKELSSIKITSTLLPSDTFTIGSSVAETLEFELFLDSDTSINKALPVKPYLSLYTEVMINNVLTPVWQKVCLGVYYINSDGIIKNGLKSLKIKASSMMNNTNYCGRTYVAAENFNGDITVIVNDICSKLGVSLKGTLPSITISKRDNINGMTYREVLNYIATLYGGYVKFNNEGNIEFFKMKDSGYIYDTSNYSEIAQTSGETLTIKKFLCALTEDSSLSSGQGSIAETVELINPDMTQSLLDSIKNEYLNYSYSPMKIKVLTGNPILEAGDRIKVIDQKGKTCEVPLQNVTYNLSGSGLTMEIESKYKINSIAKGTSIRKAVSQLNQEIIKTNIIVAEEIEATNGKFENIKTDIADINIAIIDKADIKELNAIKGTINVLDSDLANIKTLVNGNLSSENIQAGGITSDRLTIADGFINNAMIANLDVSKINAGDISTNKFRIVSDSGKMLIADNTIQIRDNNRARVQIGKDASNDYSMYVWDNTGKLMFDATGLKADGIKDNIIRDDMISDNANIDGSKININSLVTEINKDTNTNVIKSSKIKLDTVGQTLDVAFDKLKTQADANANLTESTSTTIKVMQGQISTAINNTQIVKDGKTTLLKDDYNKTVAKVNSIDSTLGSHSTKINALTGNITNVDTKVNSVQRDLDGTKSTVSSHTTQINGLNSTVSTQETSINQLKDKIVLKVEASDVNKAKNEAIDAAKSSMELTAKQLKLDFANSGAYNILKNSKGKNGTNFWLSNGGGIKVEDDATFEKCFYTQAPSGIKYSKAIRLKNNTEYVYEGYIYSRNAISGNSAVPLHFWCNTTPTGTGQAQLSVLDYRQEVKTVNKWTKCYVHFRTAASGDVYFTPFIYIGGSTKFNVWVTELSLSESSMESKWTPHPDEIYNGSTIIDGSGVTVNNGALTVKNKAGSTVLSGDSDGNLTITGDLKSKYGEHWVGLNYGGITFQDAHNNEQLLRAGSVHQVNNRDLNGVSFALAMYGDYIRFSHIEKEDLTTGWNSSNRQYGFMDMWATDGMSGTQIYKGINVYSPMYLNGGLRLNYRGGTNYQNYITSTAWNSVEGLLGLYGDNGTCIGYQDGSNLMSRIVVTEAAMPGTGDNIKSWGNWNCSGYTVHNATFTGKWVNSFANLTTRTFTETTCIEAENKQVRVNFSDIQLKNGKAILNIPNRYMHINTGYTISSIVKKGRGDVWVSEELENRFIIEGTEDIKVNIEVIIYLEDESLYTVRKTDDTQLCIDTSTGQPIY